MVSGGITPTPTYDGNGNQKTATPATLTWNALNQPITVNSTSATYDALGRMVEEIGDMIPISTPQKIFSRVLQFNSRKRAQLNHGQVAQASTPEMVMRHEKLCPVHRVLCDERALR